MSRMRPSSLVSLSVLVAVGLVAIALADPAMQHDTRPGIYPADFALTLDQQAARKFTANDIRSFVYRVFSMYERATSDSRHVDPRRAGTNRIEMRRENRTPAAAKMPKSLIVVR